MTVDVPGLGKITASKATLNGIACALIDARRHDESVSQSYYDQNMQRAGDIYKRSAEHYQKQIRIIYEALDAVNYFKEV